MDLGVGNFNFYYTVLGGTACELIDSIQVEIFGGDAVSAGSDMVVCATTGQITLEEFSPAGGVWEGVGLVDSQTGLVDIGALDPDSTYTMTYTSEDLPSACASDEIELSVLAYPSSDFTVEDTLCANVALSFGNTSLNSDAYLWTFGDGDSSMLLNTIHQFQDTGTYEVVLEVMTLYPLTDSILCSDVSTQIISVSEPPPLVAYTPSLFEGCAPLTVEFSNQSEESNISNTYIWDLGNGDSTNLVQPQAITYQQGNENLEYEITLSATNECGTQFFTDTIIVFPQPLASFGTDLDNYCSGDSVVFENNSFGLAENYFWDLGNGNTFNGFEPPLTEYLATGDTMRTYVVTMIADNFCGTDTVNQIFNVSEPNVTAFINMSEPVICLGEELCLESFATLNHPVQWDLGDGLTTSQNEFCHIYAEVGTYEIALRVFGCGSDTVITSVEVQPRPMLEMQHDPVSCENTAASFNINTDAIATMLYFGDGDSSFFNIVDHVYDSAGTFPLSIVASSIDGCVFEENGDITILPAPEAAFIHTDSLCAGEAIEFTNLSDTGLACNWNFGDTNSSIQCNPSHIYEKSGTYEVALEIVDESGCPDSIQDFIFIRPTPVPSFQIDTVSLCAPAELTFINETRNATNYYWEFGDGTNSVNNNPGHSYPEAGEYSVSLTANYEDCEASIIQTVNISNTPQINYESFDITCFGLNDGTIEINNTSNYPSFLIGNGIQQQNRDVFAGLPPGLFELRIESSEGCDTTYEVNILEPDELQVNIQEDVIDLLYGDSITIFTEANFVDLDYVWSPAIGLNDATLSNPITKPDESTVYFVTATDPSGCSDTDEVRIIVDSNHDIDIPNAFSPGGDGVNDYFEIPVYDKIERINSLQIFTRWGGMVFEATDFAPGDNVGRWDGLLHGRASHAGVYVYKLKLLFKDGFTKNIKGDLTLLRY